MFDKLKSLLNKDRTKRGAPIVSLNDADKVYLACARRNDARFAYVLALVCNRQGNSRFFELLPRTEVMTFDSNAAADAYCGAIQQVSKIQRAGQMANLFSALDKEIKAFNQQTR